METRSEAGFYQNTFTGDKVDLTQLPIPKHWPLDGGRYAGTADCVITRDPDTGYLNVGTYRIKNVALGMIASPIIAFQDADDISHPNRFDDELSLMRRTGAHVVGCSLNYISEDGSFIRFKRMPRNANFWLRLGKGFVSHHPTTIVRREVLETLRGFDGTTKFAADADFGCAICCMS